MTFWDHWKVQIDSFMTFLLVALMGGLFMACFSPKIQIRYLFGSILAGCSAGAIGAALFENMGLSILLTVLGVLTAPITIAKITKVPLWKAMRLLLSAADDSPQDKD